jgi:hypothetical protein
MRAVPLGGRAFGGGGVFRHDDMRRCAQHPAGERHRLRVIAGGISQHAARAFVVAQLADSVERPAKLERADPLKILALEEHLRPGELVERARGQHGRAVGVILDAQVRVFNFFKHHFTLTG